VIDDPVQDIIDFTRYWWKRLLLSFMNEEFIVIPGDPMKIANNIEPLTIYFERLESEPDPRRVAQLNRRSRERKLENQRPGVIRFCAAVIASSKFK